MMDCLIDVYVSEVRGVLLDSCIKVVETGDPREPSEPAIHLLKKVWPASLRNRAPVCCAFSFLQVQGFFVCHEHPVDASEAE